MSDAPRILVIRRDNIGDLVCTTPLLQALRERHPQAWIGVLVNSYNAPVLEGNRCVDTVFRYRKQKHSPGESRLRLLLERARLAWALRRLELDAVLVASPGARAERMAARLRTRQVIVRGARDVRSGRLTTVAEPAGHEVERTFALGAPLGAGGSPPPVRVFPSAAAAGQESGFTLGIHISARKPSQRWPVERFRELVETLDPTWRIWLFWAPGPRDDPMHPGDDNTAKALVEALSGRVAACPTRVLGELIDGLAGCNVVFCSDGGAMHLAAGLGKPIVCLFGDSDATRWHPWGVPYRLLQPASRHVRDVTVADALEAIRALVAETQAA
jgi:ADP-heptose:LPS heptosyltransferase